MTALAPGAASLDALRGRLRCPDCRGELRDESCAACGFAATGLDFRPRAPKPATLLARRVWDPGPELAAAVVGPPAITWTGPQPPRGSTDLLSLLVEETRGATSRELLDLGCGPGEYRPALQAAGFRWTGVDLDAVEPALRADAHALPFADASFDVVFTVAFLEHAHNPFLAVAEAERVLRPGGLFVGTVAFGEPFHGSFLHPSAWGLASLLASNGLSLGRLWRCQDTLEALATMGGYPRAIRPFLLAVERLARLPLLSPRGWRNGRGQPIDSLTTAASLGFSARKAGPA